MQESILLVSQGILFGHEYGVQKEIYEETALIAGEE